MIYINYIIVSLREGSIIVQIKEIVFKQLNEFKELALESKPTQWSRTKTTH